MRDSYYVWRNESGAWKLYRVANHAEQQRILHDNPDCRLPTPSEIRGAKQCATWLGVEIEAWED